MARAHQEKLFLGLDLSTQQLKAVVTNNNLDIIHVASVQFDTDFPEYRSEISGGVRRHVDGKTVTAPVLMWVKAVDLILERLQGEGVNLSNIYALSGGGQQHGSVYWKQGSEEKLRHLDPSVSLRKQLDGAFSILESPVWMDSSTDVYCKKLENAVGGPKALAEITGSKAFHRFTGCQIAKIYETDPATYRDTERISLVSSFVCSLFLGQYVPIDFADASGMNLMDIRSRTWNETCLKTCAPNLTDKLGMPVASNTVLGKIHPYFVQRWKFSPDCSVVAFTGDNPASMAGLNLHKDDIAISLGTGDTVFAWLFEPVVTDAHVMCNPLQYDAFMAMLCFKNGSLTRERVRQHCQCATWEEFNQLLLSTSPGNDGHIGFYFDFDEILPNAPAGDVRFGPDDQQVKSFPIEIEARAVIEHQCLAKRAHLEDMNYKKGHKDLGRVLVTGGASVNTLILQVLADVFGAKVYTQNVPHSAAAGGAYRAKHAIMDNVSFHEVCKHAVNFVLAAEPRPEATKIYDDMVQRYKQLESTLMKNATKG